MKIVYNITIKQKNFYFPKDIFKTINFLFDDEKFISYNKKTLLDLEENLCYNANYNKVDINDFKIKIEQI